MNFKNFLRTYVFEPRLIDVIALFYLFLVFAYTASDFNGQYPPFLITSGAVFHLLAFWVWYANTFKKPGIEFKTAKKVVYKILPFGLLLTYYFSIHEDFIRNNFTSSDIDNFILFGITSIPMIIYFFYLEYGERQNIQIPLLTRRKRIFNLTFVITFFAISFIGEIIA